MSDDTYTEYEGMFGRALLKRSTRKNGDELVITFSTLIPPLNYDATMNILRYFEIPLDSQREALDK